MGWWPVKLVVVLNVIVLLGYAMIDCVVAGQILSAVSPDGGMSVVVGKSFLFGAGSAPLDNSIQLLPAITQLPISKLFFLAWKLSLQPISNQYA